MFTVVALQHALKGSPQALLEFAALKDFSGENVSLLLHVSDWKRAWLSSKNDQQIRRERYIQAVQIYSHFISLEFSEFPINISSRLAKGLCQTFGNPAKTLNRARTNSDQATPFDSILPTELTTSLRQSPDHGRDRSLEATLGMANLQSVTTMAELGDYSSLDYPIPDSFGPEVFDAAEQEITYLVLTSTWPKFVHAGLESASRRSSESSAKSFSLRKYFGGSGTVTKSFV